MENLEKYTLACMRSTVLTGWLLISNLNDERGYHATLANGIPDGTTVPELIEDLQNGEYDDYLDELRLLHASVYNRYKSTGFYIAETWYPEEKAKTVMEILAEKYPAITKIETFLPREGE